MRRRPKLPVGFIDTRDAAVLTGLAEKSLTVYRLPRFAGYGPPHHRLDGAPCYLLTELRAWAAERATKARAKADAIERRASISVDDPRLAWLDKIEIKP